MAEMSFEQSMKILESAGVELERIDEARGAFSMRKFERALNSALREVDQYYLESKDHRPAFAKDGRSYYGEIKPNTRKGVTVYVKCNPGWSTESVMRRLIKSLNLKLYEAGISLEGDESWEYSSTKDDKGVYVHYAHFNPPRVLEVDQNSPWIRHWNPRGSVVQVNVGGKIVRFKHEKQLSSKIIDNGSRQLTGHSSDDLWVSTDRKMAILVNTSCIHPAAGIDYSARLLTPEETKKYLSEEKVNESWRDDFEEDGLARFHLYLKLYDETGTCIEDEEFGGDPHTYGHGPIDETEVETWINKIKRQWNKGVQLFSQKHDPKTEKLVIKGSPVIGSEDYFVAKSYDWTDKHGNKNKAWEDCWY